MSAPSFVLSGPAGTLTGSGVAARYPDVHAAAAALRDGGSQIVVGALPFDPRRPAALIEPRSVSPHLPPLPRTALPTVRVGQARPDPQTHTDRVAAALRRLRDTGDPLEKVVLARALELRADEPLDPLAVLARLLDADPDAYAYLADLTAAGAAHTGAVLIGASPELLVARNGRELTCQPFAGSAPRSADPVTDAAHRDALAASAKNRHEHQLVVDAMTAALAPLCRELTVSPEPQLSSTATVWHLSTPIRGILADGSTTALDLALALHPTPAVGGVPTAAAVDLIAELEGDRGFYAGAVGWCEAGGDGRWVVAIRGAELAADRRHVVARAGGGIVAQSDAADELAETSTKFRTVLGALGVCE